MYKLFRKPNILPIACQYILFLMLYIVDNQKHSLDTRNKNHLYLPVVSYIISYHLFSFHKSARGYIIHMDMEIVIFVGIKG